MLQLKGEAMRWNKLAIERKVAVTTTSYCSSPEPAISGRIDLRPEALHLRSTISDWGWSPLGIILVVLLVLLLTGGLR